MSQGVHFRSRGVIGRQSQVKFQKKNWVRGGVTKKRHGHNFDFSGLKRIAKVTHRVDYTCYSFQTRKLKILAIFLTPLIFGDRPEISKSVDFEQQ